MAHTNRQALIAAILDRDPGLAHRYHHNAHFRQGIDQLTHLIDRTVDHLARRADHEAARTQQRYEEIASTQQNPSQWIPCERITWPDRQCPLAIDPGPHDHRTDHHGNLGAVIRTRQPE